MCIWDWERSADDRLIWAALITPCSCLNLCYLLHLLWKLIAIFLPDVHRKLYQVVVAVFGAQHGGDLPQVGSVVLLLHTAGEGDGDDSLCDVDQVQLVALLQGLQQTRTPVRETETYLPISVGHCDDSNCTEQFCISTVPLCKNKTEEDSWTTKDS